MKRTYQAVSIDYESQQYTGTYYVESGTVNVLYLGSKKSSRFSGDSELLVKRILKKMVQKKLQ